MSSAFVFHSVSDRATSAMQQTNVARASFVQPLTIFLVSLLHIPKIRPSKAPVAQLSKERTVKKILTEVVFSIHLGPNTRESCLSD